jgi:hypothetical protein
VRASSVDSDSRRGYAPFMRQDAAWVNPPLASQLVADLPHYAGRDEIVALG